MPHVLYVSTMPYVLDVPATPPLIIFMTQKVIDSAVSKAVKIFCYLLPNKGLCAWCQCDCTSVTSEIIYMN